MNIDDFNERIFNDDALRLYHLERAKDIALKAFKEMSHTPKTILTLSRNWISDMLVEQGLNVTDYETSSGDTNTKFDTVLAIDETFTMASSEDSQRNLINKMIRKISPGGVVIASLRDYRNNNYHRRPIGDCIQINIQDEKWVSLEINDMTLDKQAWNQNYNLIRNDTELEFIKSGARRTLYFKQLAKYCADANCTSFNVLKDTFWYGSLRRTPEHILWARF